MMLVEKVLVGDGVVLAGGGKMVVVALVRERGGR